MWTICFHPNICFIPAWDASLGNIAAQTLNSNNHKQEKFEQVARIEQFAQFRIFKMIVL